MNARPDTLDAGAAAPPETSTPQESALARLQELAAEVDAASRDVGDLPVGAMRRAVALREAVEAFHKEGVGRILAKVVEHPAGDEIARALGADPFVQTLLAMHGLVRPGLEERILDGLVDARPWLREHGGDIEYAGREGNVVYVRLSGSCTDCTLAPLTLHEAVFNAIKRKAPEIERVELAKDPAPALETPEPVDPAEVDPGEGWIPGPEIAHLPDEATFRFDTDRASLLIHRSGETLRAYHNACPHKGMALDGGLHDQKDASELTCPWHGWRFDLSSGDCVHMGDARLQPVPLLVRGGVVWLRP